MNHVCTSMALLLSVLIMDGVSHAGNEFPVLEGPYLGQKPPGLTPVVFAPGIISTKGWEYGAVFTPGMKELYWVREVNADTKPEQQFVVFEQKQGKWHQRVIGERFGTPTLSTDGKTMFFGKNYKERTADGWSEMKSLGPAFEEIRIMGLTASAKGTLVLDENARHKEGYGILRYSRLVNGKHEDPKPLPKEINTGRWNAHPFIAPDESYIMWDGERESGYGSSDLYISFRQPDGSWGEAINLGNTVNTEAEEGGPQVTPDGKYLFFNRMVPKTGGDGDRQSDLYWIDAQIIETLRPKP